MIELSLSFLFRGFNAPKFVIYLSLLIFVVLLSIRLDNRLPINYFFVFLPLWCCNLLVFVGAIIGIVSFIASPPSRNDIMIRVDFVAMLCTAVEHLFLFVFESLAFYKMQYNTFQGHTLTWVFVFSPVFLLAVVSIGIAIWAIRHDKSFEFEFFYAINIIQFTFIAFKLDDQVEWCWAVVFIPLWVVLSLSAVGVLYALILSIVLARSRHLMPAHRRQHVYSALLHTLLVIPALICLVLLTGKLDSVEWTEKEHVAALPYTMVLFPLMVSLMCMVIMAIGHNGGNVWWFAMRRPFCTFLLDTCPCMRQYANVSYKFGIHETSDVMIISKDDSEKCLRPVVPLTTIECVD